MSFVRQNIFAEMERDTEQEESPARHPVEDQSARFKKLCSIKDKARRAGAISTRLLESRKFVTLGKNNGPLKNSTQFNIPRDGGVLIYQALAMSNDHSNSR
jgi:hypothetical protein